MPKQVATKSPKVAKSGKPTAAKAPIDNNVETVVAVKRAKKAAAAPAATPAAAEDAAEAKEPVAEEAAAAPSKMVTDGVNFLKDIAEAQSTIHGLKSRFKVLEKQWAHKLAVANKIILKKMRKTGNRKPSGFLSPTLISDELAGFLQMPVASVISRVEATRQITAYIQTNKLVTGKVIRADDTLSKLLHIPIGEEFTYFLLQRLMARHYKKKGEEFTGCASMIGVK
jgi:hypothetical protein